MKSENEPFLSHTKKARLHFDKLKPDFVGRSQAYESLSEIIKIIAQRECSITIIGETGTGKEVVARKIHEQSRRADGPFVPVDCTTLTGQLFESQLFGHVKGAFTGAISDTLGFFRAADGGTILLDEVGELESNLQGETSKDFARLLRCARRDDQNVSGRCSNNQRHQPGFERYGSKRDSQGGLVFPAEYGPAYNPTFTRAKRGHYNPCKLLFAETGRII